MNGMEKNEIDPATLIRIWPLDEMCPVNKELSDRKCDQEFKDYFLFADYSIWAHGYALRLTSADVSSNSVIIVGGERPIPVADSFADFLRKFHEDPDQLF